MLNRRLIGTFADDRDAGLVVQQPTHRHPHPVMRIDEHDTHWLGHTRSPTALSRRGVATGSLWYYRW
jgi:hypothetical protein